MNFNSERFHRRSIRLQAYDYHLEGMYFVTICTYQRHCYFGEVIDEKMCLSRIGKMAEIYWNEIPYHYNETELNDFVIMPNHIHGLISIIDAKNPKHTLGTIVRSFKSSLTNWVRKFTEIEILWQKNYYEHVVRNEKDYERIAEYISNNPLQWAKDSLNPRNNMHDPKLIQNP